MRRMQKATRTGIGIGILLMGQPASRSALPLR